MKKKFLLGLMTMTMCAGVALGVSACNDGTEGGSTSSSVGDNTDAVKFEGDMLYNGFDSVADMYKVSQLYEWNYSPMGKLEVVNKDNFIPVKEETGLTAAEVVAMIDALPAVSEVTLANKDAVQKARSAYGSLSDDAKREVTNLDELKALEASEALAGYYTIGDFGGDFVKGIRSSKNWTQYGGKLLNPMSGTAVFTAEGLPKAEFVISLFHDGSVDAGQAGDGIMFWLHPNGNNSVLAQNSINTNRYFHDGKSIESNQAYTFYVTYNVAEDYSKLTVTIRIVSEEGDEIVSATEEITSFTTVNFGTQTIESWLKDHANVNGHQTFTINTFNTDGVSIQNVWTPVKATDYNEPAEDTADPHNPADLAPRQGDGALRVYYERGTFTEIFARFDQSALKGMPVKDMGSFSVKVYNDSADEKQVELSLMKSQHQVLEVEGGNFTLAPYTWTECKVTLDPIIVDYFASDLIGINVRFQDVTDSVYYLDDLRVQFGKIYTDETNATIEKVNELKTGIQELNGKLITAADKETLETLTTKYLALPQAYRFTVDNYNILDQAVDEYFALLAQAELDSGELTVGRYDTVLGAMQLGDFSGGTASYSTEEKLPGENGAWRFAFDGTKDWITIPVSPMKPNTDEYKSIHIWVNNASDSKRAVYLNWKTSTSAKGDCVSGSNVEAGFLIPANSGWVELVYEMQFTVSELNVVSLNEGNGAVLSVDSLYIGKIMIVTHYTAQRVIDQIEALPAWSADYTDADKAAVVSARNAYEALNEEEKAKVTNLSKLTEIEGQIAAIYEAQVKAVEALIDALPVWSEDYTDDDKAAVAAARAAYDALPEAAKNLVGNVEVLSDLELKIAESELPKDASIILDFTKNVDQVAGATSTLTYSHSTAENALKIDIADTGDLNVTPAEITEYKEIHVWVKNTTDKRIAFYVDWNVSTSAIGDSVTGGNVDAGFVIPSNSGWVELVYTATGMTCKQFNIIAMDGAPTSGSLFVGKVQLSNGEETPDEPSQGGAALSFSTSIDQATNTAGTLTHVSDEHAPEQGGAAKLVLGTGGAADLNVVPNGTTYDEIHVWVKNDSANQVAIALNWAGNPKVYDASGVEQGALSAGGVLLPANSGWLRLVYTGVSGFNQINVWSGQENNVLYLGDVFFVTEEEEPEQPEGNGAALSFSTSIDQATNTAGTLTHVSDEHAPEQGGAAKLVLGTGGSADLNVVPNGTTYDEIHVWVKNDSANQVAIALNWAGNPKVYDASGVEQGALSAGGVLLPANSGWLRLVYTGVSGFNQINVWSGQENNVLYFGDVFFVTKAAE